MVHVEICVVSQSFHIMKSRRSLRVLHNMPETEDVQLLCSSWNLEAWLPRQSCHKSHYCTLQCMNSNSPFIYRVVQPLVEFVLVNSLHMSFDVLCTDGNCVLDLRPWVCKKAFMVCGLSVQTVLIWSVFLSKAILIDALISQLHFAFYKTQRKLYHASVSAFNYLIVI